MTNPCNRKQPLLVTIPLSIPSFSLPAVFAAAPRILVIHSYRQDQQEQQRNGSASPCPTP